MTRPGRLRAARRRRAKASGLALAALLGAALAACGHYGPPVRSQPAPSEATPSPAPAQTTDPFPQPGGEAEPDRHAP
jgi:hypothetical protein